MDDKCRDGYVWNYQAVRIFKQNTGLEISMSGIRKWGLQQKYGIEMRKIQGRWAIKKSTIPTLEMLEREAA